MDARAIVLVIAAIGLTAALIRVRFAHSPADRRLDRAAHERIARRLDEIQQTPPGSNGRPGPEGPLRNRGSVISGPRRRLWRDTSTTLLLLGTGMIVILITTSGRPPSGAVLGATGTPELRGSMAFAGPSTPPLATDVVDAFVSPGRSLDETAAASESPGPTPFAVPAPVPPTARPSPSPTAPAAGGRPPSSDRLAVLTPCRARKDCYVYVVRRGDNLVSIAHWFGIPYLSVLALNPHIREHALRAGDRITLPTPRR